MLPIQAGVSQSTLAAGTAAARTQSAEPLDLGPDLMQLLRDASDELTQSLSGKVQEKKLKERKASGDGKPEGLARDEVAELNDAFNGDKQEGTPAEAKASADRAVETLARKLHQQPSLARQHAKEQGGGATEQYLLLCEAAEQLAEGKLGNDPGGRAQAAAREAAAELLAEHGGAIRADLNTHAALRGLGREEASLARADYRDVVVGEATVADFMRRLLERVPDGQPERFETVLSAMRDAAGLDLAAARPSTDRVRLQALVSDLNHMKVIGTAIEQSAALSATLTERHAINPPVSASKIVRELVSLTADRWVDSSRFNRMTDDLGLTEPPAASVHFLTGARNMLKELPVQIYGSAEARQTVLDAAQSAIDYAIDREEGLV